MMNFQQPGVGNQYQNANQVNEGFNYPTLMEQPIGLNIGLQQNVVPIQLQNNPMQRYQQQANVQLQNEQVQLNQALAQIGLSEEEIQEQKKAYEQFNGHNEIKSNSNEMINQYNDVNQQQMMCNQGNFILEINNYEQPNYSGNIALSPYSQKQKVETIKMLAGILVNLEKQKITMLIRAYQKGSQVSSQCCFLRNNQEQFFQPMQRKQTFCLDKDNGDLFVYNNNQLLHFTQNGENWMVASSVILFKPEEFSLKFPLLHILENQKTLTKLLLMIESAQIIVINIVSHQIIKTLVLPELKSRPILFCDNSNLYLIGGKESSVSAIKISLEQLFNLQNPAQDIKYTSMTIKYEQWMITKSSLHDAIVINVQGNLYILGRKQSKSLQLIINNKDNTMTLKYTDNNYLKLNEKVYFIESNMANINGKQIIYLSEDLQKQIIKSLKF